MDTLLDIIKDYLKEVGWSYFVNDNEPLIRLQFSGTDGDWDCFARAYEDKQQVVFYSMFPKQTPKKRRADMAEFLTRANFYLDYGNFEMDFDDGEVRFRTSIAASRAVLTKGMMAPWVQGNVVTMNAHFAMIEKVMDGKMKPKDAIEAVLESQDDDDDDVMTFHDGDHFDDEYSSFM